MDIAKEIGRFKMDLLRKMPFYGDVLMRLPIVENRNIATACTNGGKIMYNPDFLAGMGSGQRNFVLMHEIFHVMLLHCKRSSNKNPALWNTAADMVVNNMLINGLAQSMRAVNIPFQKPNEGIFAYVSPGDTVENVYQKLLSDNKDRGKNPRKVLVRRSMWDSTGAEVTPPYDLLETPPEEGSSPSGSKGKAGKDSGNGKAQEAESAGGEEPLGLSEQALQQLLRECAVKNRSSMGSYFVPGQIYNLTDSKKIKWQTLFRNFFTEEMSDESSYTTPERKYIHMDLIIPGHSLSDERLEEVWAFVDSSGSIGSHEMEEFLTQLYRISKEFKCIFNICYWDTEVTDVYKKIARENDILKSIPRHSGGTDINCVYKWLKDNRVKPDVMLILTDGYFGLLDKNNFIPSLAKKTILVLSGSIAEDDEMKRMGKITRL